MPTVLVAHPSPDVYGSDRQLLESIAGLEQDGWEVTVCLPGSGPLLDLLDPPTVRLLAFPVLRKALLRPGAVLKLLRSTPRDLARLVQVIRAVRPDVVYVNTLTIPLWIVAARLCRVPVLVHVHEAEEDPHRVVRAVLAAPLLLASRIVANSRASQRVLTDAVPALKRRTLVIPNGIPDRGVTARDLAEPGRLALVARLSPRKGVDVALEAVALLRADGRDVTLDAIGSVFPGYEWYEAQLRARAALPDLAGAVRFAGYLDDTSPALGAASVVLVPSRTEPFGNTAVEGLFAGRPVVASEVQGLAEIISDGRTGLLVPPDDPIALAKAVGRLLDDPDLAAALATSGRADAEARFTNERYRAAIVAAVRALRTPSRVARSRSVSG